MKNMRLEKKQNNSSAKRISLVLVIIMSLVSAMMLMVGCASGVAKTKAAEAPAEAATKEAPGEAATAETPVKTATKEAPTANAPTAPAPTSDATLIGEEEAKKIALEHAGLKEDEVTFILAHQDYDDGFTVYDVEFYKDMAEYDYEIDAYTGDIISCDYDIESIVAGGAAAQAAPSAPAESAAPSAPAESAAPATPAPSAPTSPTDAAITADEAKAIALQYAGVSESDAKFVHTSFEYDDGFAEYQIDFIVGTTEYEVEVDANTGNILGYDAESLFD